MKTKQEQTKQMLKILCDKFQCSAIDRSYMAKSCRQCEDIIEALNEAGYGDISEYKSEIEQLKEETSNIRRDTAKEFATRICEMLWNLGIDGSGNRFSYGDLTSKEVSYVAKQFGVDIDDCLCKENTIATSHINKLIEQDKEIKKLEQQVKQAQIDVLNKLKRIMTAYSWQIDVNDVQKEIDELIEEVENDRV